MRAWREDPGAAVVRAEHPVEREEPRAPPAAGAERGAEREERCVGRSAERRDPRGGEHVARERGVARTVRERRDEDAHDGREQRARGDGDEHFGEGRARGDGAERDDRANAAHQPVAAQGGTDHGEGEQRERERTERRLKGIAGARGRARVVKCDGGSEREERPRGDGNPGTRGAREARNGELQERVHVRLPFVWAEGTGGAAGACCARSKAAR